LQSKYANGIFAESRPRKIWLFFQFPLQSLVKPG
jgi:hypothetical protein